MKGKEISTLGGKVLKELRGKSFRMETFFPETEELGGFLLTYKTN